MDTELTAHLAEYRTLRRHIEGSVLTLATSLDGRRFTLQAPLEPLTLRVGGYVVLEASDGPRLGQLESLEMASLDAGEIGWQGAGNLSATVTIRYAAGAGTVYDGGPGPFHDAPVRPATSEEVADWQRRTAPVRAQLAVGELRLAPGVGFALDSGGFDRHTFLCGQSGSGKTYALGTVLERLLIETSLEVIVLDPNSDFVRLHETREDVTPELAERHRAAAAGILVHRGDGLAAARLRVRLPELQRAQQAAALQLDPAVDRDEYAEFVTLLDDFGPRTLAELHEHPAAGGVVRRARNLGVDAWSVWAREDPGSTLDALEDSRCLVVDLGSLGHPGEQALVAGAVLARLWERRAQRRPRLIVIDEAHNVCPALPEDGLTAFATELAIRIAAEGRKFGLYLLVSTQRPQKVHENVVSQCDNLMLMRMNSVADLGHVRELFSYAPLGLLDQATTFRLGEALVAGKFASHPALVKVGPRIAEEGGADVPATWAQPAGTR
jgi:hypothetical protein